MAIDVHLVEKTNDVGARYIDGIQAALIAIDDSVHTTSASIQQAAVDKINTEMATGDQDAKLPDGYFDTSREVASAVSSLALDTDDDIVVFGGGPYGKVLESIA